MDIEFFEVGGCVRDALLGIKSKDVDFAVVAPSFDAMVSLGEPSGWPRTSIISPVRSTGRTTQAAVTGWPSSPERSTPSTPSLFGATTHTMKESTANAI